MATEDQTRELVEKAQAGDAQAFEILIERYRTRLERQIESRMGHRVRTQLDPADVVQDAVTRALQSVALFRWQGEDSFYRWLASIAEHLIWNASKKKTTQSLRLDRAGTSGDSPSRTIRRDERFSRLEKALAGLSPDHRKALILSRVDGLTLKEISERMDRSPGAVQKLLTRAVMNLRQAFGDTESLHLPDRQLRFEEDSSHE